MSGNNYDKSKSTVWASELKIPPTETNIPDDNMSDIYYSAEDEPSTTEVSDVKQRMRKLLEEQLYTDVTFYPKNGCKSAISAHRAVLAVGSPLFTKMLFDDHKNTAGMKMKVEISNLSFDTFSNIVKYLYTDDIFLESDSQVQDILVGAQQFQIQSLVDRCNSYFENQELTEQNVCSKLEISISNNIDVLKRRCKNYIQENTFQVIHSSDFLKCSSTTVCTICKLQSFNLKSEVQLLGGIVKWLHDQPLHNKRQLVEPILKCIRFLNLTTTELGYVLKRYPFLLTPEDGLQILLYLQNPSKTPDFKSLPSWCNKDQASRCIFGKNTCGPRMGNALCDLQVGKVILPLKFSYQQNVTELTSLLRMKCVNGYHQIKAIKLTFQGPVSNKNIIESLSISVHVEPSGFRTCENFRIANSLEVLVPFSKVVKARRGDSVNIEVEAHNIQFYKFRQFDDTLPVPSNPHFECCVSSRPKFGKLYFISEIEYGPQENPFFFLAQNKRNKKRDNPVFHSRNRW